MGKSLRDQIDHMGITPTSARWTRVFHLAGEHFYFFFPFMVVLTVFCWFLTYGTWKLFEADDQRGFADRFYDAQAFSLLQGRLDVPPEAIGFEAFVHDGKTYGYFGLGPAILRVPLLALFPSLEGRLSRLFMLLACVANMIVVFQLIHTVRYLYRLDRSLSALEKTAYALFFLLAGLGSTNIFLASRSFVYHEAIMLGATFGLLFYHLFLRYLVNRQPRCLLFACLAAFFCCACRPSLGAGPMFTLVLFVTSRLLSLAWKEDKPSRLAGILARAGLYDIVAVPRIGRHLCVAGGTVVVTVCFFLLISYAKFGTLNGAPLDRYAAWQSFGWETYEKIDGKMFHLCNLRAGLYNYLSPDKIAFSNIFPWVYPTDQITHFPESKLGWNDYWSSIPISKPALFILSFLGVCSAFIADSKSRQRILRLPLLGSLGGGVAIFVLVGYVERYVHDCYPFMLLAGAAGLHVILVRTNQLVKPAACLVVALLTVFSVYTNTALALVYQRELIVNEAFPSKWFAEKSAEFQEWRRNVDRFFGQTSVAPLADHELVNLGLEGSVDEVDADCVHGWAWISSRPNKALYVDIYDGDTLLTTSPAFLFRQDLFEEGIGNGRHGFQCTLPQGLNDGRSHTVRVKVSGSSLEIPGSPKAVIFNDPVTSE
jgi:hypothetical protein